MPVTPTTGLPKPTQSPEWLKGVPYRLAEFERQPTMNIQHNEKGHMNVFVRDQDSVITGFGKHARVVAFLPQWNEELNAVAVYVRVDLVWDLPEPTEKQILEVMKKDQGIKGKWVMATKVYWEPSPEKGSIDYHFVLAASTDSIH